jgi:uncharacterized protein (DUF2237 family)
MRVRNLLIASALLLGALACSSKETATPSSPTAPTTTKGSLSGTVLGRSISSASVPISGATVLIIAGPDAGRSAMTNDSGNFSFTGLQESQIVVSVSAVDYYPSSAIVSQSSPSRNIVLVSTGPIVVLTGRVTDASTSAPVPGATVSINGRYATTSDGSGNYSVTGHLDQGASSVVYVWTDGYEEYSRYIGGTLSQSFPLQRIERITAGDSWSVTIGPDDSLCINNTQDPQEGLPGTGYRCRRVRVLAPVSGVMTLEAISTSGGAHPAPLEVEPLVGPCCSERMANPTSIQVTAGTEVGVFVELPESATSSQSFTLNTSMARP